jgi:hypothetical protein
MNAHVPGRNSYVRATAYAASTRTSRWTNHRPSTEAGHHGRGEESLCPLPAFPRSTTPGFSFGPTRCSRTATSAPGSRKPAWPRRKCCQPPAAHDAAVGVGAPQARGGGGDKPRHQPGWPCHSKKARPAAGALAQGSGSGHASLTPTAVGLESFHGPAEPLYWLLGMVSRLESFMESLNSRPRSDAQPLVNAPGTLDSRGATAETGGPPGDARTAGLLRKIA